MFEEFESLKRFLTLQLCASALATFNSVALRFGSAQRPVLL